MSGILVHRIIKSISSTEKIYFKKYAFKRQNKGNDNYKILFDILNNSDEYDLKKIQNDKRLDKTFKKNIAVSLTQLHSKLMRTLIDYRDNQKSYKLFNSLKEIELYIELGLNDQAKKALLKTLDATKDNNSRFLKPYINQKILLLHTNNSTNEKTAFKNQITELHSSVSELQLVVELNTYGYELDALITANGGMVLKDASSKERTKELIITGYKLAEHPEMNVYFLGALVSNLLLLELMVDKFEGFDRLVDIFVHRFDETIEKELSEGQLIDMSLVIKNLAVLSLHFSDKNAYDVLDQKLEQLCNKAGNEETRYAMLLGKYQAYTLNCVLHEKRFQGEMEEQIIARFNEVEESDSLKAEFLVVLLILQIRNGAYKRAIDLSTPLLNAKSNHRFSDDMIIIKLLVGLAWYKLEELEVSESYIRSAYRNLLKQSQFVLRKPLIKLLRALSNGRTPSTKILALANTEFKKVASNGTGFEKSSAQVLLKIANLAFESIPSNLILNVTKK